MPTVEELGRRVKEKYPGSYDDLDDAAVGRLIKKKYPEAYQDFQDIETPALPMPSALQVHQRVMRMADDVTQGAMTRQGRGLQLTENPELGIFDPTHYLAPFAADPTKTIQPGALPAAGELTGSLAGPYGAVAGSVAGKALEDILNEGETSAKSLGMEAVLTAVPEVFEAVGRPIARWLIRSTEGAKQIRFSDAAQRARRELPQVFEPPTKQAVDAQFEALRSAGVDINFGDMVDVFRDFSAPRFDVLMEEVKRIDRKLKTGGRYAKIIGDVRAGRLAATSDVGDLQTLRSELRKRVDELELGSEGRQLVKDLQFDIDDAIDNAIVTKGPGAGLAPTAARDARRAYARYRAGEEMADFVEQKITSTPDISDVQFNLRSLWDDLRRNRGRDAKQVNRALDMTPGAREALAEVIERLQKNFQRIELSLADVSRGRRMWIIAMVGGWLSDIMLTVGGRRLFEQAVLQGRGRLSPNTLAVIANIARREIQEQSRTGQARTRVPAFPRESQQQPVRQIGTPLPQ